MLKACERLPYLDPDLFYAKPREEQMLILVYAQERDQEEAEQSLGNLGGGKTKKPSARDKVKGMKFRKKHPPRRGRVSNAE